MRIFASQTSDISGGERQEILNRRLAGGALLQRKTNCACGGGCPKCQSGLGIQPKLKVGAAHDKYEQEADRVAEQIVSGGYPSTERDSARSSVQRMCDDCEEEENSVQLKSNSDAERTSARNTVQRMCTDCEEEEENSLQLKSNSDSNAKMPSRTESDIQSLGGGGVPLSRSEAQYYEPRFGHSFSKIRIHTGEAADRAARSINASAFTLGNNIAFARGEYDFGSVSGRKLMAHELTHTLQQSKDRDSVQRGSAGILGGKCCNRATRVEWSLVGAGVWKKLEPSECTGTLEDCDGMTCGGGFYHVDNGQTGRCSTPRRDDATFAPRRWTPTSAGASALSPEHEGSTQGNTPPTYVYDEAATAACPNGIRTITVDFVKLHGSTLSQATELASANTMYSGCCIRFVAGAMPPQETQETTEGWLDGDTDVDRTQGEGCGNVGGEEQAMFDGAATRHNLSSRMRVFFVASFSTAGAAGYSIPPYCATGLEAPYVNHVVLQNSASTSTNPLAHEFGHILLNNGDHTTSPDLMAPTGGTVISATDCATAFSNA